MKSLFIGSGFVLLILLFVVGGSLAVPVSNENKAKDDSLDNYIKAVLEMLKAAMPNGLPDLGIPVLEPLAVPHFDIPHIDVSGVTADITIDKIMVNGLSTFESRVVHVELEALTLELDLFIPKLRAEAEDYTLDGVILGLFPLYGSGGMFIELGDLDITATADLALNAEGYLQIKDNGLKLGATFGHIELHLDNLLGGGDFGEVINQLLSALGPTLWDLLDDDLFNIINDALTGVINSALDFCSVSEIVAGTCSPKLL